MNKEYLIYWPEMLKENQWGYKNWVTMDNPIGTIYMNKEGRYIYLYKKAQRKFFKKY